MKFIIPDKIQYTTDADPAAEVWAIYIMHKDMADIL
jgi:hypothetical protein